jgi:membrane associated rhomboid family serine protease
VIPLKDTVPRRHPPVMLYVIIGLNVAVFLFETSLSHRALQQVIMLYGLVPARYTDPEWARAVGFPAHTYWPFLTNMFLHAGWLHILGNMWFFYIFGDNVEDRMGVARFGVFYLLCGLAADLTQLASDPGSKLPALGASGAISGVMGAYLLLYPRARIITLVPLGFIPLFFELPAVFFLVVWFLFQLLPGVVSLSVHHAGGGIAWWAHVGGFFTGMLLLPVFLRRGKSQRPLQRDEFGWESAWRGHR